MIDPFLLLDYFESILANDYIGGFKVCFNCYL